VFQQLPVTKTLESTTITARYLKIGTEEMVVIALFLLTLSDLHLTKQINPVGDTKKKQAYDSQK
jgi:hypothetical protein